MTGQFTRAAALLLATAAAVAGTTSFAVAQPGAVRQAPTCAGHTATIVGTARGDEIHGTPGRDVIVGLGGGDDIEGRGGNDIICGGVGNDELEGDRGADRLYGGPGYDDAEGGPGHDICVAEQRETC
jgi:Ca2+-binding RTX toxin-like protein